MNTYLKPTFYFDFTDENISEIVNKHCTNFQSQKEKAVACFYAIRDGWYYNPYEISFRKVDYKSSAIANKRYGHCIDKSILLVACMRAINIPARIHLAKVKNHIAIDNMIKRFGTDEITPHGMVDIFLDDRWIKVSPAFNKELCLKLGVDVLDFDGENDAIFHPFSKNGDRFMEYLEDFGSFEELPIDFIFENFTKNYAEKLKEFEGQDIIKL